MNRSDFQRLTRLRLDEAKVLLANERYQGAYYLIGYAVECALKACIAKQTKLSTTFQIRIRTVFTFTT